MAPGTMERWDSGHLLLVSGMNNTTRPRQGTGCLLSPEAAEDYVKSGRQFQPINSRFSTLRITVNGKGIYAIISYAPQSDAPHTCISAYQDTLTTLMEDAKPQELMLMPGDYNAKLGKSNGVCGDQGLAEQNEVG